MKWLEKPYEIDHPVYRSGKGSGIFNLVGLPLLMLKADLAPGVRGGDPAQLSNEEAKLLMLDINLTDHAAKSGEVGTEATFSSLVKARIDDPVGPVIVVRAGGGHITRQHIETFCEYIKQEVKPKLSAANSLAKWEAVLTDINKAKFTRFAIDYQMKMGFHHVGCQGCDSADCTGTAFLWEVATLPWHTAGSMWLSHRLGLDRADKDDPWTKEDDARRGRGQQFLSALPPGV